jgi:S1-C subfamily serine protease
MTTRTLLAIFGGAILVVGIPVAGQVAQQKVRTGAQEHLAVDAQVQAGIEANTNVMESTFKIEGNNVFGSGFILARPYTQGGRQRYRNVLVTAAHVLSQNDGEFVRIYFRRRTAAGTWESVPTPLRIRSGAAPLWQQHPQADVAVMYVVVPAGVLAGDGISTDKLADDAALRSYRLHPGDEVACDGFPLGAESKPFGFPILRTGRIASYPILPTAETKFFLLDFPVFPGNSGGPAYIAYGVRPNEIGIVTSYSPDMLAIVGVVSKEQIFANRIPLGIAEIVHSTLIAETIMQLPPPEQQ